MPRSFSGGSAVSVYTNAKVIAAELRAAGYKAGLEAGRRVRHVAMLTEARIKGNASGRPGPRAITGDYRRSWTTEMEFVSSPLGGGAISAVVGTNKPQGPRLEKGFVGVDSLGRHYDQPPFPHVEPAMGWAEASLDAAIAGLGGWADR